jgi:hypothetical protein
MKQGSPGSRHFTRGAAIGREALAAWLNALFGAEPDGALIEVRHRLRGGGMGQRFFGVRQEGLSEYVHRKGRESDVFIGVAPRTAPRGGRDAIRRVNALWADCDGSDCVDAVRRIRPRPAIVVRSGSRDSVHAYWPLWPQAAPDEAEKANRRLAHHLGADPRSTDAARILRPPGTLNFKHTPAVPVELVYLAIRSFTVDEVVGKLPDLPHPRPLRAPRQAASAAEDALLAVEPPVYVAALAGRQVGRDRKIYCPLHEERTPSFHVYDDPERGWYCFGCSRGGTIYDLARELSGIGDRGAEFERLREWISERLLNAPLEAAA